MWSPSRRFCSMSTTAQPGGVGSTAIRANGRSMQSTQLEGDTPDAEAVKFNMTMLDGRFFNSNDQERAADVVVLGY